MHCITCCFAVGHDFKIKISSIHMTYYLFISYNMMVQKSPDIQEKPFACDIKGCDMTFTNKDHLDWHHKKHEMMLNLGLINKNNANEVADQTPTPTRFIRNCEEVGLFQDLQNVNPFDEIFKKAAELVKSGVTLEVQENNSDDTLHTPHILPHITENQPKDPHSHLKNDSDCETFLFPHANKDASDSNSSVTIVIDDNEDQTDLKRKIKESIQNKINNELRGITQKAPVISVVPFQDLTDDKISVNENTNNKHARTNIEKIREMNRAAQNRCRKKKQQLWREMGNELAFLRQENKSLKRELQALALLHSKCPNKGAILPSIVTPECSETTPTPKTTSPVHIPLFIQVIPNAQISVLSSESEAQPNTSSATIKENVADEIDIDIQQPLKKLVPRIIRKKKS